MVGGGSWWLVGQLNAPVATLPGPRLCKHWNQKVSAKRYSMSISYQQGLAVFHCITALASQIPVFDHFCQLAFAPLGCLSETWLWNFNQIWSSIWPRATLKARIPQSSFVSVCLTLKRISKAQHFKNHQLSMLMRTMVISRVFCFHKLSQQQGPVPCLQTRTFASVACSDLLSEQLVLYPPNVWFQFLVH